MILTKTKHLPCQQSSRKSDKGGSFCPFLIKKRPFALLTLALITLANWLTTRKTETGHTFSTEIRPISYLYDLVCRCETLCCCFPDPKFKTEALEIKAQI